MAAGLETAAPPVYAAPSSHAGSSAGDSFARALVGVLREMPYNSATEFLTRYGATPPDPRLGAACIHQTIEVARRVDADEGTSARLLQDERHVAAVWDVPDGLVVLDPYLLHREPIRFPRAEIDAGRSSVEVLAAPTRLGSDGRRRAGRLSARYRATSDGYHVRLTYSRWSAKQARYVLSRHFTLRSENVFDIDAFTADMPSLLTDPEQNSLSIRALTPGLETVVEAILPLEGFARRQHTSSDLWLRSSDGGLARNDADGSRDLWDLLEISVGVTREEITGHILSAATIYRSLADPAAVLERYQLEDV